VLLHSFTLIYFLLGLLGLSIFNRRGVSAKKLGFRKVLGAFPHLDRQKNYPRISNSSGIAIAHALRWGKLLDDMSG